MLASAEALLPSAQTGLYFDLPSIEPSSLPVGSTGPGGFKKRKTLPHPRNPGPLAPYDTAPRRRPAVATKGPSSDSSSLSSSPPSLKHENRRLGGPDLPPTPPAHLRNSPSNRSILPSGTTCVASPEQSSSSLAIRTPGTPPNQKSPPTPDVTPPQPARRPKAFRPLLADRIPSKATTADSRTESFKTAREDPYSSEEDKRSTLRPKLSSGRTSRNTVRLAKEHKQKPQSINVGLSLDSDDNLTPRTKQEFYTFDGEWGSGSEVVQEWDDNLNRNVMVRKRLAQPAPHGQKDRVDEVVEDRTVAPTNATKALRSLSLQEKLHKQPPTRETLDRSKRRISGPPSESSASIDLRRASGMSSKSTVSTVVEAILVDAPPQRRKTLRHVRKQTALRDSGYGVSPSSSTATSIGLDGITGQYKPRGGVDAARSESYASSGTNNSLSSRKARRDVWKSGGIPVVVIPDRKASKKSATTTSLRSTSSRRSQRSNSMSSVPLSNHSKAKDMTPYFDKPVRRGRTMSESDGSLPGDQRTIDYPPIVPIRRSSLSAPTSRNNSRESSRANSRAGSRSNSLTAESLRAHDVMQQQQTSTQPPKVVVERVPSVEYIPADEAYYLGQRQVQTVPSVEFHKDAIDHKPLVDHNGDPFFGKRLTTHYTPFSQASVDTNGTHSAAEVSEAMAVNIYPHQNKSVLMVDHSSKTYDANALPRESSAGSDETEKPAAINKPTITTTGPDGGSITPPHPQLSMDDVDSPLRNPREPPEPPAIKLTPATPSGLTPTAEKMKLLGNYFDQQPATKKRPSLVKRALSLRKTSDNDATRNPGFLSRTLSLSKNIRKDTAENPALDKGKDAVLHQYPTADDPPPDEERLHPFWRPSSSHFDPQDDDDYVYDVPNDADRVYRYPAIDNRPSLPRRSLSSRMKHTFAILPITSDEHYLTADAHGTKRRTIKRTSSGNLRVMRHRGSSSTLRWGDRSPSPSSSRRRNTSNQEGRPSTAPDRPGRRVWGIEKRVDPQGRRFFPGWQDKFEQYGLQNLHRRLSERRRQKRTEALRQMISGPREVRDGVGDVVKRNSYKGPSYQSPSEGFSGGDTEEIQVEGVERAPKVQVQV